MDVTIQFICITFTMFFWTFWSIEIWLWERTEMSQVFITNIFICVLKIQNRSIRITWVSNWWQQKLIMRNASLGNTKKCLFGRILFLSSPGSWLIQGIAGCCKTQSPYEGCYELQSASSGQPERGHTLLCLPLSVIFRNIPKY